MSKIKMYVLVRRIKNSLGITIEKSKPMRYEQGMQEKQRMLSRDCYYDEGESFVNTKKWVYWLSDKTNNRSIKVRLNKV